MEKGVKHLVTCRCFLPQYKGRLDAPLHQFIVFSVMDDDDTVKVRFAQCNNCGVIHKVTDICKSDIMAGREQLSSLITLDEIKKSIPEQLAALLETHNADLATWEHAKWVLDNQRWGDPVMLTSEMIDGMRQGKFVRIIGENLFKVDTFTRDEIVTLEGK